MRIIKLPPTVWVRALVRLELTILRRRAAAGLPSLHEASGTQAGPVLPLPRLLKFAGGGAASRALPSTAPSAAGALSSPAGGNLLGGAAAASTGAAASQNVGSGAGPPRFTHGRAVPSQPPRNGGTGGFVAGGGPGVSVPAGRGTGLGVAAALGPLRAECASRAGAAGGVPPRAPRSLSGRGRKNGRRRRQDGTDRGFVLRRAQQAAGSRRGAPGGRRWRAWPRANAEFLSGTAAQA